MIVPPVYELLLEARRLIQDASTCQLGQNSRPSPHVASETMGKLRDAAMLITRFLEAGGVHK